MSNQLVKKNPAEGYKNVFPKTWIDAIKDKESGVSLQEILQGFNMYFLSYNGSRALTRCKVPSILRKEGLWITYVLYDHTVVTEWYNSDQIDDNSWSMDSNWRVASNFLVGDVSVSADGYWVINGEKTEAKAQGEQGVTPLLRVGANNKLQVSYNAGKVWKDISDYIVPRFRWNQGTGTSAGNVQISMDLGKTWTNLSNEITNNLRISRYIGINESLPTSGVAEGTIYMKGPYYDESDTSNTNPVYRMWVYAWKGDTLAWQDNGEFTTISAGVVQERGTSTTKVMSQDAVSKELSKLESKNSQLDQGINGTIGKVGYYLDSNGGEVADSNYGISVYIPVLPNTTYVWKCNGSYSVQPKAVVYNATKVMTTYYSRGGSSGASILTGENGAYIRVSFGLGLSNNTLELNGAIVWEPEISLEEKINTLADSVEKTTKEVSFYNVTENVPLDSGYYTLSTAIAAVPVAVRKKGLHIIFTYNSSGWSHYWFNGGNTTSSVWTNTENWMKEKTGIVCLTENPVNFDLVEKKMKFHQYGSVPKLLVSGSVIEISRGTEIDITSSYNAFSIIYDAKSNTFSTTSLGTVLYNEQYYFAHIIGNVVFAHPVVLNYTVNGNPPTIGNAAKGDVGYIANVEAAIFDFEAGTMTLPGFPDSTKVYANGRATTFTNTSGLTIQLAGTNEEGVIVFDFADNTIKTYVRNSAYTAPATSVLIGWYNAVRKIAYLAGRFTIRGQHNYWDYSDLPTFVKDGISAHIQKVVQNVINDDLVFDFITDTQTNDEYAGCRISYIQALNASMQISKFTVNGGDFVSGFPTAEEDIKNMSRMYHAHKRDIGAKDLFMCQGNHDGTWQKWNSTSHQVKAKDIVTDKTWTNMFLKNIDGAVYDSTNPLGGYLYKDYEDKKVRIIILNTCDICVYDENGYLKYNAMYDNAIRQQQLDWLVNYALDFSAKGADKTNWGIIVFTHFGVDVDNDWFPHGAALIENVLQAFKSGTAINQSSEFGTDFQLLVNHDFSTQGAMNYIAYIHGHTHTDRVLFNNGVPHIATASANGYYNNENPPVGGTCPARAEGTLSYYCWDTMQYNKEESKIIAHRFGAGADRHINLGVNSVSVGGNITLTTSLSGTITWTIYSKSSANVASINNGVVTGIESGNATACAEDENGVKEFFGIVVK